MIIVTGANGFIGSALVWELNCGGRHDIVLVDTIGLKERPELLKTRSYHSFLSKDEIWPYLERSDASKTVEAIVHMGACSTTTEMNVEFLTENNVEYTRRLWKWCTLHKKKFIYASSAAVYGDGQNGFDDASPSKLFSPLNPYGESKAAFDVWVEEQVAKKEPLPPLWLGLRFFNVYGPNEGHKGFMRSVVHKAHGEIKKTGELSLFRSHNPNFADGQQMRDFVYVKDITRWIHDLISRPSFSSGIYNMGFGRARTWLDLANAVFTSMGHEPKIKWIDIPESMRARYQYFTEAKIERLLSLGLTPPDWSLEKAIDDYVVKYLSKENQSLSTCL